MLKGRICKGLNGLYQVLSGDEIYMCRAASRIRKEENIKLLAGDIVNFSPNGDGTGFIESINPRKNSFIRPAVANADRIAIVVAGRRPMPLTLNIDKLCCIAEANQTEVMLIFTKSDLGGTDELNEIYSHTPYRRFTVGKDDTSAVEEIKSVMRGSFTVLTGASGVGKSTLLNLLFPGANAVAGDLSRIDRGKNTTRATEIFRYDGCLVADTPGFSMLDYTRCIDVGTDRLINLFPEADDLLGKCRYTKCSHTKEEGCEILKAVSEGSFSRSRHESYLTLYAEAKANTKY